jgi:hypothetical protein
MRVPGLPNHTNSIQTIIAKEEPVKAMGETKWEDLFYRDY